MEGGNSNKELPKKHIEMETNPMMKRDTFEDSIQKMQDGMHEYKPSTYALFLDANGYQMVEILEEENNENVKVRTLTNKFFECPKNSLTILQPEIVQLIKGETETNCSTKDDEIERKRSAALSIDAR